MSEEITATQFVLGEIVVKFEMPQKFIVKIAEMKHIMDLYLEMKKIMMAENTKLRYVGILDKKK